MIDIVMYVAILLAGFGGYFVGHRDGHRKGRESGYKRGHRDGMARWQAELEKRRGADGLLTKHSALLRVIDPHE